MPSLQVDEITLHYHDSGSGPALVLLHGLGSSGLDWEYQYPDFETDYRVIAPDLRGFGQSDRPQGPYLVARHAQDLCALLDHLGIETIQLLGFSMGGAVAFEFAASYPERVERLIIVNSAPSFVPDHWRKNLEVIVRKSVIRLLGMPQLARLIAKRLFPGEHQQDLRTKTIERYGANHRDAYLHAIDGLVVWKLDDEALQGLAVPTLVIAAEHDYTPFHEKQDYCAKLPQVRLVQVADSRHATPIEQPELFNSLVRDFLGEAV